MRLIVCILMLALIGIVSVEPSHAQMRQERAEFVEKHGGATYRLPSFVSRVNSLYSHYVFIDDDGRTFALRNNGFRGRDVPYYIRQRSRVRLKPFSTVKKIGACVGVRTCYDPSTFSQYRVGAGDVYQLKSRDMNRSLELIGVPVN